MGYIRALYALGQKEAAYKLFETINLLSHVKIAHDSFKTCRHAVSHNVSIFGFGMTICIATAFINFFFFFSQ